MLGLGYGSGAHLHSGGELEADDIAAAVAWAAGEGEVPVAILGCSAGGHASVAAADRCDVFAVVTDSSFVSFAEVVADQGAEVLGAPASVFRWAPSFMKLMTGRKPAEINGEARADVPMLHIHGDADSAISHDNLSRLAGATGGEKLTIQSADHIDSLRVDPGAYAEAVIDFLRTALINV